MSRSWLPAGIVLGIVLPLSDIFKIKGRGLEQVRL